MATKSTAAQSSAGSDVKTEYKIIGGQVVKVQVSNGTAKKYKEPPKERAKLRKLSKQVKHESLKKLKTHSDKLDNDVKSIAKKISNANESIAKNQDVQNAYQDFLSAKGSGVANANTNIKVIDEKVASLNAKIAKSKRKSEKASLQKQIASLTEDRAKDSNIIASFSADPTYQAWVAKNKRATATIKNMRKSIEAMRVRKAKRNDELKQYNTEIKRRDAEARRKRYDNNRKSIRNQIHNDTDSITHMRQRMTYIFRDDYGEDTMVKVLETSPSEQNQVNVPQKSVDSKEPMEHYVQNSGLTLTGQYTIFADTDAKRVAQYNILRKWQNDAIPVHVHGFVHWEHVLITSISRAPAAESSANGLQLSIDFMHARLAKIKYAKQNKSKRKHKANSSKKSGTSKTKHRSITIKPGMTYSQVSAKLGIKVSTLRKLNPKYKDRSLPIGGKMVTS